MDEPNCEITIHSSTGPIISDPKTPYPTRPESMLTGSAFGHNSAFSPTGFWHCSSFVFEFLRLGRKRGEMALGLILGLGRAMRRKRTSSLDILSSKRAPRDYYKGKNCKPTGFHTRKGGYVVVPEKLPNYVVPDLTDFKLKPYVSQCPIEAKTSDAGESAKS